MACLNQTTEETSTQRGALPVGCLRVCSPNLSAVRVSIVRVAPISACRIGALVSTSTMTASADLEEKQELRAVTSAKADSALQTFAARVGRVRLGPNADAFCRFSMT